MNKELLQILMMTSGAFLFALGGLHNKFWRRFVLPAIFCVLLGLYNGQWIKDSVAMALLCIFFHLPYGERTPYWGKALVGLSWLIPSIIVLGRFSLWQPLIPIIWIIMFRLSNWKYTEKDFTWKVVEVTIGLLIAASLIV